MFFKYNQICAYFLKVFFCWFAPFGYLYFSYFFTNEPELAAGIDLGMALNVDHFNLVFWIRRDSNPQPSNLCITTNLRSQK
jgi:hypothetical protein